MPHGVGPDLFGKAALPWIHMVPWFAENLHWWEHIKDPEVFVSKICVECLQVRGMTWPALEARLLDSSSYLASHPKTYSTGGTRRFYWHQVGKYRHVFTESEKPAPAGPLPFKTTFFKEIPEAYVKR